MKPKRLHRWGYVICDKIHGVCMTFKDDGCTLVPDEDFGDPCCRSHDLRYEMQDMSRLEADRLLLECINAAGHPIKARIYYLGVRLLGGIFWYRKRYMKWMATKPSSEPSSSSSMKSAD